MPVVSANYIHVTKLEKPIDVNGLLCFIPLMTAYTYALDRIQVPTHIIYAEDSYVYYFGNHSVYNWVIEPEKFWNELTRRPAGVVFVYGDPYPLHVEIVWRELEWGLGNKRFTGFYFDTLYRRVVLTAGLQYKPPMEDNIEIAYNGKVYILIPLMTRERGFLHIISVFSGYTIVDEKGNIMVIDAKNLERNPLFRGLPLLPEVIARKWVEIYRFKPGFIEVYFYHNTFEIRDVDTNPNPTSLWTLRVGNGGFLWPSLQAKRIAQSTSCTSRQTPRNQ